MRFTHCYIQLVCFLWDKLASIINGIIDLRRKVPCITFLCQILDKKPIADCIFVLVQETSSAPFRSWNDFGLHVANGIKSIQEHRQQWSFYIQRSTIQTQCKRISIYFQIKRKSKNRKRVCCNGLATPQESPAYLEVFQNAIPFSLKATWLRLTKNPILNL